MRAMLISYALIAMLFFIVLIGFSMTNTIRDLNRSLKFKSLEVKTLHHDLKNCMFNMVKPHDEKRTSIH